MRGRKPRAIEVQEASGAFEKNPDRRPKKTISSDSRSPTAPSFIESDETAFKVWNETVDVLRDCGILSKTDTHLLATYCSTYSEWTKCHTYIQTNGHEDSNGKTSPQSVAYFKLSAQHMKLIGELGLSPSSRARLSVVTSAEAKEETTSLTDIIKTIKGG